MTHAALSEPLVPVDCDLRGLPWMPIDTVRLLDSDLFALATGDEFKAAVALWCKAWQQVPAASLPNDDRVLAHLSGAGSRWKKVMPQALRGFVLCADGRWYHPVIAEKALEAWSHRKAQRERAGKRWHKPGNATGDPTAHATACPTAMQGTGTGQGQDLEKTGSAKADLATASPCPHLEIIGLYHKHLPMGRQVKPELWSGTRAKHLQARWREEAKRQKLGWWEKFFVYCAESKFLTGQVPPNGDHKQFEISLDWIVNPQNFVKIYEGKYHS